ALSFVNLSLFIANARITSIVVFLEAIWTPHETHHCWALYRYIFGWHASVAASIRATFVSRIAIGVVVTEVHAGTDGIFGKSWAGAKVDFWNFSTLAYLASILVTLEAVWTIHPAPSHGANVWYIVTDACIASFIGLLEAVRTIHVTHE
ncbi:hypothetical protein, partial [Salmonella sp. s54395]|uniref:hypothetical protein n=1 Tax=Salmonella sp. s54395 TaxID=3159664 RepID=UPI00397F9F03